jgi:hypothetical protein
VKKLLFIPFVTFLVIYAAEQPIDDKTDIKDISLPTQISPTKTAYFVGTLLRLMLSNKSVFNELASNVKANEFGYSSHALHALKKCYLIKKDTFAPRKKVKTYFGLRLKEQDGQYSLMVHPEDLVNDTDLIKGPAIVTCKAGVLAINEKMLQGLQLKKYESPEGKILKVFQDSKDDVERNNTNLFISELKIHSIKMPYVSEDVEKCKQLFAQYFISYELLKPYIIS